MQTHLPRQRLHRRLFDLPAVLPAVRDLSRRPLRAGQRHNEPETGLHIAIRRPASGPAFMLSETAAVSQSSALAIQTPTGTTATGNGVMALRAALRVRVQPGRPGGWCAGLGGFYVR